MKLFLSLLASGFLSLQAQDTTDFCGKLKTIVQLCNDNAFKEDKQPLICLNGAQRCYLTWTNNQPVYTADFDETEDSKYDFMPKLSAVRKQVKVCLNGGWTETKTIEEESAMMESARELETNTYDIPDYMFNSVDKKIKTKVNVLMQRDPKMINNKPTHVFVVRVIVFK
jgi:hypothetical protein